MNKAEELEILIDEKKKIEQRIRELKEKSKAIGVAKIDQDPCGYKEHYVAIKRINVDGVPYADPRYRAIIVAKERENAIKAIPDVVRDLQRLYCCLMDRTEM